MRFELSQKPYKCPGCDSAPVATILYGLRHSIDVDSLGSDQNTLGCVMTGDDPTWRCTSCGLALYENPKWGDTRESFVVQA